MIMDHILKGGKVYYTSRSETGWDHYHKRWETEHWMALTGHDKSTLTETFFSHKGEGAPIGPITFQQAKKIIDEHW